MNTDVNALSPLRWQPTFLYRSYQLFFLHTYRQLHIGKFEDLLNSKRQCAEDVNNKRFNTIKNLVVNLSSNSLSTEKHEVLSLGKGFAIAPNSIPY